MTEPVADAEQEDYPPSPFSFKLMIVLTVLYLGWRLIQGIVWLWSWLT